jgi:hypothetical protein
VLTGNNVGLEMISMLERRGVAGCILAFCLTWLIALAGVQSEGIVISKKATNVVVLFGGAVAFALAIAIACFLYDRHARPHAARHRPPDLLVEEEGLLVEDSPTPEIDELIQLLDSAIVLSREPPLVRQLQPVELTGLLAREISGQENGLRPGRLTLEGKRTPLVTLADADALSRVFRILISNALASGSQAVLRLDRGTTALVVHVDDNGPGVPRSEREAVFDRAYHMDILPSRRANHCAELVFAKQIARAFGGDITIRCSPEGGARFTLRLPLLLAHETELQLQAVS